MGIRAQLPSFQVSREITFSSLGNVDASIKPLWQAKALNDLIKMILIGNETFIDIEIQEWR